MSKWRPRYLTVSVCGMVDWLMYNGGQVPFRRVNVICADICTRSLWFYRLREAAEALLVVIWQVI